MEDIHARELFYGDMRWLFDCTHRFRMIRSGDFAFFAFGKSQHIRHCRKPVFLDFGDAIVEVLSFTDDFPHCDGYGRLRDRQWMIGQHLSDVALPGASFTPAFSDDRMANPWETKCPYFKTEHAIAFVDPVTTQTASIEAGRPCINVDYVYSATNCRSRPITDDIIDKYPDIANGWKKADFGLMKNLISARAIIFEGRLSLMPAAPENMRVGISVASMQLGLKQLEDHIQAGRVPVLKPETKAKLISLSEDYERDRYGHLLGEAPQGKTRK